MDDLKGKRVTVAGLGRFGGGIAVARWLVGQGAVVTVVDRDSADKLAGSIARLDGLPIDFHLGEEREEDFTQTDLVVASPALPPTHPGLAVARGAGISVTTEIALFLERNPARVLAVTGTKGKSTTTALLSRMLATHYRVHMGGNIGISLLDTLTQIRDDDLVLLELSSFMLHFLGAQRWSPHGAVLAMIGTDHVEWHGTVDAYREAKAQIVLHQSPEDFVVYDATHHLSQEIAGRSPAQKIEVPADLNQRLHLNLPGEHNQRNAQLALFAAMEMGVTFDEAQRAVDGFSGLSHRLELVNDSDGVRWFDDSIATIPDAAIVANHAFDLGKVIQIVGGYDKRLDMTGMCRTLARRCKAVLTIGTLGPLLASQSRFQSAIVEECETLERAVARARSIATSGDIVLLSTGCASYDQFSNFEERGNAFARLARHPTVPEADSRSE